uniref:Uncharacterized protein n=1 Tax=viral metagenome TaxID=1070528 RepID=A0A6C0EK34_9ZZZZ
MTSDYRTIQISDDLFWGYHQKINISLYTNTHDIIAEMNVRLINFLDQNNLQVLKAKLNTITYTLPGLEIIKSHNPKDIIYMCICNH